MGSKVALVQSDEGDWEGLYIDGELVAEDHRIESRVVLMRLAARQCTVESFGCYEVDQNWMEENWDCTMPHFFSDLPDECKDNGDTTP